MRLSELQLLSKNDIPFDPIKVIIHPPTIKQIGLIGQDLFWTGCQYLNFSKNNLKKEDKVRLENLSDFEVLMTMMRSQNTAMQQYKIAMTMVLSLMFPDYVIDFTPIHIRLKKDDQIKLIGRQHYGQFKDLVRQMYCLDQFAKGTTGQKYDPLGLVAQKLVQKFKKRNQTLAKIKGQGDKDKSIRLLSRYVSILAVGEQKDMNELLQYSVYQLFDEYHRFMLRQEYEAIFRIKLAGGKDVKDAQNWMIDIHSNEVNF